MQRIFSTSDVHPRDRFDFWHQAACRTFIPHESAPASRAGFTAEIEWAPLGDSAQLIRFANSPMRAERTQAHCAAADADDYFLCRQIAGSATLEQAGRAAVLQPGGLALLDPARPYRADFAMGSRLLVLKAPRAALDARLGSAAAMAGHALAGTAEASLASDWLGALPGYAARLGAAAQALAGEQALDLAALALSAHGGQGPQPKLSAAKSAALLRLRAAIDARLADHTLDSATAAAAAGLSVRYANALLAEQGLSLVRLIQQRRLDRCRRALADPAQRHRTITDIALGWGFSDMTHFGRCFKAAYGCSPRDWRAGSA